MGDFDLEKNKVGMKPMLNNNFLFTIIFLFFLFDKHIISLL